MRTNMIDSIETINDIDALFDKKLVLYGTGKEGKNIYEELKKAGIQAEYFCDGNFERWGKHVANEVEIISPGQLRRLDAKEEIAIIISIKKTKFMSEIAETLLDMRLRTQRILTEFGLRICFMQNINHPRISKEYRKLYMHTFVLAEQHAWMSMGKQFMGKSLLLLSQTINDKNFILIYQPGKVGSKTISASMDKIGIAQIHAHNLTAILNKNSSTQPSDTYIRKMPDKFKQILDENLSESCSFMKSQDKVRIITLVREPVSRDYSRVFQHLANYISFVMSPGTSFVLSCIEYMKKISLLYSEVGQQFKWFDLEIKSVFGVDVFAHPFDKEAGYSIIKQDNVEVLIMKLEKLNTLESVIGEFVGSPNFKLVNSNESEQKGYKYFYKSFRETIKLPRSIFDFYYKGNPRVDHFYTEEEKASFIKKWEKNIED